MEVRTFAKSVIGASHLRKNTCCEDASWYDSKHEIANAYVLAVADGHGSDVCKYSADGSRQAVNTFQAILKSLTDTNKFQGGWGSFDKKIGDNTEFAKILSERWQKRIAHTHRKNKRPEEPKNQSSIKLAFKKAARKDDWYWNVDYMLYGTTLLGIAIIGTDVLVYQIGDGDIIYVNRKGVRKLMEGDHFLGVETYSLAYENAWDFANTAIVQLPELMEEPGLIMLSTDGMSNSYASEADFLKTCQDYFEIIEEDGFDSVCSDIGDDKSGWLRETSDGGCGDDISLALAYFTPGFSKQDHSVEIKEESVRKQDHEEAKPQDEDGFRPLEFPVISGAEKKE